MSLTLSVANIEMSYFILKQLAKWGKIFGKDREDTMPIYTVRLVILYKMFDDMFLSLEAILDGKLPWSNKEQWHLPDSKSL